MSVSHLDKMYGTQISFSLLPGEYWYGLCVQDGLCFPLDAQADYAVNLLPNATDNQAAALLASSKGRTVWCEEGIDFCLSGGTMHIAGPKMADIHVSEAGDGLRGAFLTAATALIRPNGKLPPEIFFRRPQYNTWIELMYDQSQEKVLAYAEALLENGYPPGVLMIDDGWFEDYGLWEFNARTFPNPAQMVQRLHQMGFTVMLWSCPFVSPDGPAFRRLAAEGLLVRSANGGIAIREWWNGHSAVLDLSNPAAAEWYHRQNRRLMERYGIDGFKLDAGDGKFYRNDDITFGGVDANGQTACWMNAAECYAYNELRAGFGHGGRALVHRLSDKKHSWGADGLAALVPNQLAQGILGYAFTCPDMIGGGEFSSVLAAGRLDEELFVRYAQCSALMPMMQYSAAPWRVLGRESALLCLQAAQLHMGFADVICTQAGHAANTAEPITRYMAYQFPGQGLEKVTDQFMLGNSVLVAPVTQKGQWQRDVCLPEGRWEYCDGKVYTGGQTVRVPAPISVLPYFHQV